jgi:hypothetical protein
MSEMNDRRFPTVTQTGSWIAITIAIGALYAAVGIAFAVPATHVQMWRLGAWLVSAIAYGAHIAHERFRLRNNPLTAAMHVALAAALGAFGLAVGANVHAWITASPDARRGLLLLALVLWPVITAVPAFIVALALSAVMLWAFKGKA